MLFLLLLLLISLLISLLLSLCRQRYAPTALCLPSVMPCRDWGCLPKITTCPRNRKIGWFYNSLVFDQNTRKIENGGPPSKSQESIVIYLSKHFFWQKHEMILWPIASICPGHFIKNVQEKSFVWATPVFLFYEKIAT